MEYVVVVGVLAAQDGSPAGAAKGVGRERVLKGRAILHQRTHVWHVLERIHVHVFKGQVVCEDQHHVRGLGLLLVFLCRPLLHRGEAGCKCEAGREQQQERQGDAHPPPPDG